MPNSPRTSAVDACPGALDTHTAADGELARIRVPGGRLHARQALATAAAVEEFGDGHLELTSRANLQARGLRAAQVGAFAGQLASVGLLPSASHEKIRNIVASPLSGRGLGACQDLTSVVDDLDRALCAAPDLSTLPGRFLVTVDDGSGDVAGLGGDVRLAAAGPDQGGPIRLSVAGPVHPAASPRALVVARDRVAAAVVAAARAFLAERATQNAPWAWRVAELPDGHDRILAAAAVEAGLTATVGEGEGGVDSGGGGGGDGDGRGGLGRPLDRPVGVVEQRDGRRALAVVVPLGRLAAGGVRMLVDASRDGCDELRLTPWRSVVVPDLPAAAARRWAAAAALTGLVVDRASPWVVTSACAGRPGCAKALADVHADASAVMPATGRAASATPVHWSGCRRRCGAPAGRPYVDVLATEAGYHVRRGDRDFGIPADLASVTSAVQAGRECQQ